MRQLADACHAACGIVDAASAAVRRLLEISGHRIACRRGCGVCCRTFIPATFAEAVPIAQWLSAHRQRQRLARFHEQTNQLRRFQQPALATLEELLRHTATGSPDPIDSEPYGNAALAYFRRQQPCPFLTNDMACEIYPLRPLACRSYWVVDTADSCGRESREEPSVIEHPTFAEALRLARNITIGASVATPHPGQRWLPVAVTQAVAWLHEMWRKGRNKAGFRPKRRSATNDIPV